jgi:spermidine synthase
MRNKNIFFGIFLIALSILVFEITLTRIFSVTLWYHLAFMAVSLAMFGIGVSGVMVYILRDKLQENDLSKHLQRFSGLFSVSIVLCLIALLSFPHPIDVSEQSFFTLFLVYAISSVPFFLGGMCISLALTHLSKSISKLYFFDLVGSGVGSVIVILLLENFTGPTVVLFSGMFAALAFLIFSINDKKMRKLAAVLFACILLLVIFNASSNYVHIIYAKGNVEPTLLYEEWNSFSRVTVIPGISNFTLAWGMSPYYNTSNVEQLQIIIDSSAGTQMNRFDGNFSKEENLKYDITSLAYYLKNYPKVLIIGPGGGRDVLTALLFNNTDVTGVEINPIIVDLVNSTYSDFTGNLYSYLGVKIVAAEGRSYIRGSNETYDLVQASLVDTWAATSAGAYSLSENNLYTKEAFIEYMNHLSNDGVLTMSRFAFQPPQQDLRIVSLSISAMGAINISNPEKHIMIFKTPCAYDKTLYISSFILKKSEFTDEEVNRISDKAKELGYTTVYTPTNHSDPTFAQLITTNDKEAFYDSYMFDVSPSTDDKPFFFHMLRTSDFMSFFSINKGTESGQLFNYYAVFVLVSLLIISTILVLIFMLGPLLIYRGKEILANFKPCILGYFALLGIAFMLIEMVLMQKFVLFLGHPVFALSVVLFSILIFSGIGSLLTSRFVSSRKALICAIIGITLTGLLYYFALSGIFNATLQMPILQRILISVITIMPIGLFMGMPLPLGIKIIEKDNHDIIPWAWGVNGATSVLGSVFATFIAINVGFNMTLLAGVLFYILALATIIVSRTGYTR